ncbi:MAG: hypothetical protein HY445_02225 [Candidatus Niyogibacteria bacterium]|nr:hypothetical protein [Candidatus Niyogibacteria bacterium]
MDKDKLISEVIASTIQPHMNNVPALFNKLEPGMRSRFDQCSPIALETILNSPMASLGQINEVRMMVRETFSREMDEIRHQLETGKNKDGSLVPLRTVLTGIEALAQAPDGRLIAEDGTFLEKEVGVWWFDSTKIGPPPFPKEKLPLRISVAGGDGQGTWSNYDIGTQLYKKLYIVFGPYPLIVSSGTGHGQRCVEMNMEAETWFTYFRTLAQLDCGIYEVPKLELSLLAAVQGVIVYHNIYAIIYSYGMYPRIGIPIWSTFDHSMNRGRVLGFGIDGEYWDVTPLHPYTTDGCGRNDARGVFRTHSRKIVDSATRRLILQQHDAVEMTVEAVSAANTNSAGCGGAICVRIVGPSGIIRVPQKTIYDHVVKLGDVNFGGRVPDYKTWLEMSDYFDNFDETISSLTK